MIGRELPALAQCRTEPRPTGPLSVSGWPAEPTVRCPTWRARPTTVENPRRHHTRGRQDSPEADGEDPFAVLPHRPRRLAHQARRPRHRGDREVPPEGRAL